MVRSHSLKPAGCSACRPKPVHTTARFDAPPRAFADRAAIFNRTALLERLLGDEELTRMILQKFLADIPRQIETLRRCLDAGDAAGAERQAHTIKGAAGSIGGEALQVLAAELEQACKVRDLEHVKRRLDELSVGFETLTSEIGEP